MYETDADRANEQRLMSAMEQAFSFRITSLPAKYNLDAIAWNDGEAKCFFEFKCRTIASNKYSTAVVNLHKAIAANNLTQTTGLKCWLVVEWTDMVGVIDCASPFEIGVVGARTDRNDPRDADLFAHYPVEGFRNLNLFN